MNKHGRTRSWGILKICAGSNHFALHLKLTKHCKLTILWLFFKCTFDVFNPCNHHWASQVVLVVKNLPASAGDIRNTGLIPKLERSPGRGHGSPCQYSCLENPLGRGVWRATVHRVTKSRHDWSDLARTHNRHYSQDTKHVCDSKRFFCASLQLIPASQATTDWPFFREKKIRFVSLSISYQGNYTECLLLSPFWAVI